MKAQRLRFPLASQISFYHFVVGKLVNGVLYCSDSFDIYISNKKCVYKYLAINSVSVNIAQVLQMASWQEVHQLVSACEFAHIISCCASGNLLCCGRSDAVISVWNLEQLQEQGQLIGHKRSVLCLKVAQFPATPC